MVLSRQSGIVAASCCALFALAGKPAAAAPCLSLERIEAAAGGQVLPTDPDYLHVLADPEAGLPAVSDALTSLEREKSGFAPGCPLAPATAYAALYAELAYRANSIAFLAGVSALDLGRSTQLLKDQLAQPTLDAGTRLALGVLVLRNSAAFKDEGVPAILKADRAQARATFGPDSPVYLTISQWCLYFAIVRDWRQSATLKSLVADMPAEALAAEARYPLLSAKLLGLAGSAYQLIYVDNPKADLPAFDQAIGALEEADRIDARLGARLEQGHMRYLLALTYATPDAAGNVYADRIVKSEQYATDATKLIDPQRAPALQRAVFRLLDDVHAERVRLAPTPQDKALMSGLSAGETPCKQMVSGLWLRMISFSSHDYTEARGLEEVRNLETALEDARKAGCIEEAATFEVTQDLIVLQGLAKAGDATAQIQEEFAARVARAAGDLKGSQNAELRETAVVSSAQALLLQRHVGDTEDHRRGAQILREYLADRNGWVWWQAARTLAEVAAAGADIGMTDAEVISILQNRRDDLLSASDLNLPLARLLFRDHRYGEATDLLDRYRENATGDDSAFTMNLLLARAAARAGRLRVATDAAAKAVAIVEKTFASNELQDFYKQVAAGAGEAYATAAYVSALAGDDKAALDYADAGRALSIRQTLAVESAALPDDQKRKVAELRAQLARLDEMRRFDPKGVEAKIAESQAALDAILKARRPAALAAGNALRLLGGVADVVVELSYCDEGGLLLAYDLRGGKHLAVVLPDLTGEAVSHLINRFGDAVTSRSVLSATAILDGNTPDGAAEAPLWRLLGRPLLDTMEKLGVPQGSHIVVVPDGLLTSIPVAALRDPASASYVLDRFVVSYAPSLAGLVLASRNVPALDGAGFTAAGIFAGNVAAAAADRVFMQSVLGEARVALVTSKGDPASVVDAMRPAPVWHFGTHGFFSQSSPRESGVLIAQQDVPSGRMLTVADLLEGPAIAPRLVVLAACETAMVGGRTSRLEFVGLPFAFLQAGAHGVIGSLWKVDDVATALLMSRLYAGLAKGRAPADALRDAQIWLRDASGGQLLDFVRSAKSPSTDPGGAKAMAGIEAALTAVGATSHPFASEKYWAGFLYFGD